VVFRGIHAVNLDAKGRLAVPARYRSVLEKQAKGNFVLTIDTEQKCLLLYPLPEWETIEEKLNDLPSFNPAARRIQRLLLGHANELEMDGNGRILLPSLLREYAGLDKRVMLIGQGKKFEIWHDKTWETKRDSWLSEPSLQLDSLPDELRNFVL
jgi:MraZ protein